VRTVAEIKEAVARLLVRQRIQIARWIQAQIPDRWSDDVMMVIAAEGARALDRREAQCFNRNALVAIPYPSDERPGSQPRCCWEGCGDDDP